MKTLEKMNVNEKAELFHKLFKPQIPDLLICMESIANALLKADPEEAIAWDGGLFQQKVSYTLIVETTEKLKTYRRKMAHHSRLFADQLFDGYQALFSVYCLRKCTVSKKQEKFAQAVELFFNP